MKRTIAILLSALLFYNMMGFYLVFTLKYYRINKALSLQIEQERITQNLYVTVKIPMHLPYPVDWQTYEKVSGNFQYQGKYYEKVKQILLRDTMFVYCIENKTKKKLIGELADYTRSFLFDLDNNTSQNDKKYSFTFLKEYLKPRQNIKFDLMPEVLNLLCVCTLIREYSILHLIHVPPPELNFTNLMS